VLEGRAAEQRRRLLEAFTDLLVDLLGVDRKLVRGRIIQVSPDDWAIGGVPASVAGVRRSRPGGRFARLSHARAPMIHAARMGHQSNELGPMAHWCN
jgi:phenylpyruvate tautomerase PptA (4-oxalocrotonate tautomerase family)